MATNNTQLNPGVDGQVMRSLSDADGVNWMAGLTAYATTVSSSPESSVLALVTPTAGLPVQPQTGATFPVSVAAAVTVTATNLDIRDLTSASDSVAAVQSGTWNIGTVTSITNAVTIQDGGNTITVDGTVAATQSGTWTVQPGNTANTTAWLVTGTGGTFPVTDSGGSLTVDAPVGTPVFVRLSDGTNPITTLPVSVGGTVTVSGTVAATQSGAWAVSGTGTAGSAASGVVTVQGVASMTPVQVSQATASNLNATVVGTGTFATQISSALPAGTNNIGDVDVASIAAGTNYIGKVRLTDGTTDSTLLDLTNANPLTVAIVDGSGNQVTAFGGSGGTASNFGSAFPSAGTAAGASDGVNMQPLLVDGSGYLRVNVSAGGGSGGTSSTFGAAFPATGTAVGMSDGTDMVPLTTTDGTSLDVAVVGSVTVTATNLDIRDLSSGSDSVAAVQSGTWNITNVSGTVSLPTGAATAAKQPALGTAGSASADVITVQGIAAMTPLLVDGSGATQPVSGTVTANQGGTWNVGTVTTVSTVTSVTQNADVRQATASNLNAQVVGTVASGSSDSGNPVKVGSRVETSPASTAVESDGDRIDSLADADGLLMVKLGTSGADFLSEAVSNTDGASTAFTNFPATASRRNVVTAYSVFRTDAGTSLAYVDFRDGTAGSVLWRVPLPPNGGANLSLGGQPIFKGTANTALAYDVSSALTTVYISISGYQTRV